MAVGLTGVLFWMGFVNGWLDEEAVAEDEAVRLRIRKPLQEDRVHDAEHGHVGPDPQGQRQNNHGTEAGAFPEGPQGKGF